MGDSDRSLAAGRRARPVLGTAAAACLERGDGRCQGRAADLACIPPAGADAPASLLACRSAVVFPASRARRLQAAPAGRRLRARRTARPSAGFGRCPAGRPASPPGRRQRLRAEADAAAVGRAHPSHRADRGTGGAEPCWHGACGPERVGARAGEPRGAHRGAAGRLSCFGPAGGARPDPGLHRAGAGDPGAKQRAGQLGRARLADRHRPAAREPPEGSRRQRLDARDCRGACGARRAAEASLGARAITERPRGCPRSGLRCDQRFERRRRPDHRCARSAVRGRRSRSSLDRGNRLRCRCRRGGGRCCRGDICGAGHDDYICRTGPRLAGAGRAAAVPHHPPASRSGPR